MRYCSKCGYPLNDDQKYCPRCGHLEPSIQNEFGVTKPIDSSKIDENKQPVIKKSVFKILKGFEKATFIYSLVVGGFLLAYLLVSLFLYIEGNGKPTFLLANQILTIISAVLVFAQATLYVILYIKEVKTKSNPMKKKVYLIAMILIIVEFAIAIGQLFWLKAFGLSVVSLISCFVTIDIMAATEKMVIKLQ